MILHWRSDSCRVGRWRGAGEMLPVVRQLADGRREGGRRRVGLRLAKSGQELGPPASRQLLQRADVEVAVVEKGFQRRHRLGEKAPVLADAVAAHRRDALFDVALQEV